MCSNFSAKSPRRDSSGRAGSAGTWLQDWWQVTPLDCLLPSGGVFSEWFCVVEAGGAPRPMENHNAFFLGYSVKASVLGGLTAGSLQVRRILILLQGVVSVNLAFIIIMPPPYGKNKLHLNFSLNIEVKYQQMTFFSIQIFSSWLQTMAIEKNFCLLPSPRQEPTFFSLWAIGLPFGVCAMSWNSLLWLPQYFFLSFWKIF